MSRLNWSPIITESAEKRAETTGSAARAAAAPSVSAARIPILRICCINSRNVFQKQKSDGRYRRLKSFISEAT